MNASSIPEFHDRILELGGYESADEYWSKSCPMKVAHQNQTPTLIVNVLDDPICHGNNIDYELFTERNDHGILVTVKRGSHCAFLEGFNAVSWHNRVTIEFLQAINAELSMKENGEDDGTTWRS